MFSTLVASKPPREGKSGALAGLLSLLFHVALISGLFWATLNVGEAADEIREEFTIFDIPEEAPPPPPPPPPPPMEEAPPPVEVVDVARGFQTLSPPTVILPDIPPPSAAIDARDFSGVGVEGGRADGNPESTVTVDDIAAAPRFTPMTVRPTIRNMDEVRRALQRFYPPLLRDAGVGGTVVLWFFINEQGEVVRTQVNQSSGHAQLDEAASRVAEMIEFTPAQNRDRNVPVWIQWPITFQSTN
jgi:protein TonB